MRLSLRDKVAYIGQSPHVPSGGPYTSSPDAPWNSQEMESYVGMPSSSYFCPKCKSVNLLVNQDKNLCICQDCKARFSTEEFETGNSFEETEIPRATGLFNTDEGSTSVPNAHESGSIGGGAASTQWGRGTTTNSN